MNIITDILDSLVFWLSNWIFFASHYEPPIEINQQTNKKLNQQVQCWKTTRQRPSGVKPTSNHPHIYNFFHDFSQVCWRIYFNLPLICCNCIPIGEPPFKQVESNCGDPTCRITPIRPSPLSKSNSTIHPCLHHQIWSKTIIIITNMISIHHDHDHEWAAEENAAGHSFMNSSRSPWVPRNTSPPPTARLLDAEWIIPRSPHSPLPKMLPTIPDPTCSTPQKWCNCAYKRTINHLHRASLTKTSTTLTQPKWRQHLRWILWSL